MVDDIPEDISLSLGRALTAKVAPEESPFFDELVSSRSIQRSVRSDHPIGFGVGEGGIAAVSIILYPVAQALLQMLWEATKPALAQLMKDGVEDVRKYVSERFRRWINSDFVEPLPIELTSSMRSELISASLEKAISNGMTQSDVDRLRAVLSAAL